MTKHNMIGVAKEEYYRNVGSKVSIAFGIALLIYSILVIHQRIRCNTLDPVFYMSFLTLALSIVILANKKRGVLSTMGLYCIGMGLTRLPSAILYLLFPDPIYMFLAGIFFAIVAVNMLWSAWEYLHGKCERYILSTAAIIFLWVLYAGLLAASISGILPDVSGTIYERILAREVLIANVVLFSVYMVVLGTDEIRESSSMERSIERYDSIRSIIDAGHDASVSRDDARKIFAGPDKWNRVDFGPIEYEQRFIVSYTDRALFGTIQKWKDDDELYITISRNTWGRTMVEATRFSADKMACDGNGIEDCKRLFFQRKNGDSFCVEVLDDNVEVIV